MNLSFGEIMAVVFIWMAEASVESTNWRISRGFDIQVREVFKPQWF